MKALVTGASSGIGYEIAKYLSSMGYDIIAVARNMEKLNKLKTELQTNVEIVSTDLSNEQNCKNLFERFGNQDIDVLVNNAGFGVFGNFHETDLNRELQMIGTNISAVHILTKLFLQKMLEKNNGYIMNVSSLTGFMPGPKMAAYYASKAYILRLTQAIQQEIAPLKTNVHVCVLCPTAVQTNFQNVANVEWSIPNQCPAFVAKYAVDHMFRRQKVILPGCDAKMVRLFSKISPDSLNAKAAGAVQHPKYPNRIENTENDFWKENSWSLI